MQQSILARLGQLEGNISFYYRNLITDETMSHHADFPHYAASIIKIPIMVEAFRRFEEGSADPNALITLKDCHRVPICGVLTLMHEGLKVSLMDLVWLMITISDNVATNLLIDTLGIDAIQRTIDDLGLENTHLHRKLFEKDPTLKDLRNAVSAADMGKLLFDLYQGAVVSPSASQRMLDILKAQQLNGKIPFYLSESITIAHKTGEVEGISHDVGIVYANEPFIICFCGSDTDTPAFNRQMGEITALLCGGK